MPVLSDASDTDIRNSNLYEIYGSNVIVNIMQTNGKVTCFHPQLEWYSDNLVAKYIL